MPIEYTIDHNRRLVLARVKGVLSEQDVYGYQYEVWSKPEVKGYSELIDMTEVTSIENPDPQKMQKLAEVAARMQPDVSARFAVVAPGDVSFGIARMYQAYRSMTTVHGEKNVGVFRSMPEAFAFLEVKD